MARFAILYMLMLWSCSAQEFCAVKVRALNSDDWQPLRWKLPVLLLNNEGDVVARTTLTQGKAQFCDFGFGTHSILIGDERDCGSVEIKNIRFRWQQPQIFTAIIERCPSEGDGGMSGCLIYFRVKDPSGRSIPYPTARRDHELVRGTKQGLIPTGLLSGVTGKFIIEASGFVSEAVTLDCTDVRTIEHSIILKQASTKGRGTRLGAVQRLRALSNVDLVIAASIHFLAPLGLALTMDVLKANEISRTCTSRVYGPSEAPARSVFDNPEIGWRGGRESSGGR
jgi:hypothetical protein